MDNHQKGNNTVVEDLFHCCLGLILPVTFIWPFEIKRLVCCFFCVLWFQLCVCLHGTIHTYKKNWWKKKQNFQIRHFNPFQKCFLYIYNLGNQERQNPIFVSSFSVLLFVCFMSARLKCGFIFFLSSSVSSWFLFYLLIVHFYNHISLFCFSGFYFNWFNAILIMFFVVSVCVRFLCCFFFWQPA